MSRSRDYVGDVPSEVAQRIIELEKKEKEAKYLAKKKSSENQTADVTQNPSETMPITFEGKINKYGFLRLSKNVYETLGLPKGEDIPVEITVNSESKGGFIVALRRPD
ncbi:MAG: hypothetical protein QMD13_07100 [Candidatus Bathyarchaeia archaeon]|nr:hypothetical protein [Candidatus Bathyarchaeia archaeon]